ncbi:MAG TPA: hypothetical protein VNZ52_10780 [Candidatus Thermoplasmatota archaeon]|nr:hypothetical protein [Candidatus Thermoplasmatota archaeon]
MLKPLSLALLGCICSAMLIAPVTAAPNDSVCGDKVNVLDLTPVGGDKFYLIKKSGEEGNGYTLWKETNQEECWQKTPKFSEGKKRIVDPDEQLLY